MVGSQYWDGDRRPDFMVGACGFRECLTFIGTDMPRSRSWHDLTLKARILRPEGRSLYVCLPDATIISQTTTDEQPPYVRVYDLKRVARAFGVPLELLTTEAN